jgi:hypothetical protein
MTLLTLAETTQRHVRNWVLSPKRRRLLLRHD